MIYKDLFEGELIPKRYGMMDKKKMNGSKECPNPKDVWELYGVYPK